MDYFNLSANNLLNTSFNFYRIKVKFPFLVFIELP